MSITIDISEAKLREVENVLNLHDPTQIVLALIEEKLGQQATRPFDLGRTLAAAAALGDLSDAEFDAFEREINRPLPPAWTE